MRIWVPRSLLRTSEVCGCKAVVAPLKQCAHASERQRVAVWELSGLDKRDLQVLLGLLGLRI